MFNKFRDKLKKTLSIFSKKTEEEAEEKEIIIEKVIEQKTEEAKVQEKEVEQKKEKKELVKKEITKTEKETKHEKEIKPKEVKEVKKEKKEVIKEEIIELPKEEKKGFFGKLFGQKEEVEEAEEEIALPEKFDVAKQKFEPDLEKIKEIGKKIKVEERLNVINERGEIIGEEARERIHQEGLLHQEIHVLIFNKNGEIVFQRRAPKAETFPNLLDASVGGHLEIGEDFLSGAVRELEEETGIKSSPKDLIFLGDIRSKKQDPATNKINNVFRKVYAYLFLGGIKELRLEKDKATSLEFWPIRKMYNLGEKEKKEFLSVFLSKEYFSFYKKIENLIEEDEPLPEEELPEKRSFFQKLKETITTKTISEEKFEELFWELEIVLMENNVSIEVIERIKQDLKKELVEKPLPRDVSKKIEETLKQTLTEILSVDPIDLLDQIRQKEKKPYIIAFFGINGAGKTTAIAKLSYLLQKKGLKTVLAAGDTFRAAAIQQLEEHALKLGTKIIKQDYGSDAAAVAFDAIKYAQKNEVDVVLIDTAGRLHSNVNLMDELKKIVKVAKPDLKIFVGEAITGNDCIEQAKAFQEMVEIDAAILTKVDVDEKGGAPLSISYTIKKPILYLGVGQEYGDLEEFNISVILKRLGF